MVQSQPESRLKSQDTAIKQDIKNFSCAWISKLKGSRSELTAPASPQPLCAPQSHTCTCCTAFHRSSLHRSPLCFPFLLLPSSQFLIIFASSQPLVSPSISIPAFYIHSSDSLGLKIWKQAGKQWMEVGSRGGNALHINTLIHTIPSMRTSFLLLGPDTSFYYSVIPATVLM